VIAHHAAGTAIVPGATVLALAERLLAHLTAHRERFESAGFQWRGDQPAIRSDKIEVPPWLRPNGAVGTPSK